MQNSALKAWLDSSYLSGANQSWIEQLYEDFLTDPDSVDANWRSTFQQLPGTGVKPDQFHSQTREYFRRLAKDASRYSSTISDPDTNVKQVKVLQLINAYRFRGHQHANLDPLGLWQQDKVADLDPSFHDLTEADFQETFNVGSFASGKETMKLGELLEALSKPTAARLVPSICTLPALKKNAGSNSVLSLVARLSIAKRKNAS